MIAKIFILCLATTLMSQIDKPCQGRACSGSYICSCENTKSYAFGKEFPDFSDVLLDPGLAAHFPISSFHLQIPPVEQPEVLKALGTPSSCCPGETHPQRVVNHWVCYPANGGKDGGAWMDSGSWCRSWGAWAELTPFQSTTETKLSSRAAEILHRPEEQG